MRQAWGASGVTYRHRSSSALVRDELRIRVSAVQLRPRPPSLQQLASVEARHPRGHPTVPHLPPPCRPSHPRLKGGGLPEPVGNVSLGHNRVPPVDRLGLVAAGLHGDKPQDPRRAPSGGQRFGGSREGCGFRWFGRPVIRRFVRPSNPRRAAAPMRRLGHRRAPCPLCAREGQCQVEPRRARPLPT